MSLLKYKYFVDAVENRSFTKAGRINYVSQTAISQQIASLEKSVGGKLFERGNGNIEVTDLGRIVYNYAKDILDKDMELSREIENYKTNYKIKIAVDSSINKYIWRSIQEMVDKYYSEDDFVFSKIANVAADTMLKDGTIDIYIGYSIEKLNKKYGVREKVIATNPTGVYVGSESSLKDRAQLRVADLNGYVRYCTIQYPNSIVRSDKAPFNSIFSVDVAVNNFESMKIKTEFNDGYALVDSHFFSQCEGLIIPLVDYDVPCVMKIFYREDRKERVSKVISRISEMV